MTNTIDSLMSRIEEINLTAAENPRSLTDDDIATLVAYHRRNRQRKASGEKIERGAKPTTSLTDITSILDLPAPKPNAPQIARRL